MNDAVDVLRHGWQDAAGIFAPDSPEIAELLQARLEMAVANRSLDENHLLGAIDDVESMAASTGSPSGQALARRLRRTVYEYLLALDAAPPPVLAAPAPTPAPAVEVDEPEAEPEEVTALGHRAPPLDSTATSTMATTAEAKADDVAPADTSSDGVEVAETGLEPAPAVEPAAATPATSPEAAAPPAATEVTSQGHPDGFVAPRAGFHVIEDTHPTHAPSEATESPLQMPAFAQPDATAAPLAGPAHAEADLATYQWTRPVPQSPPQAPAAKAPAANGHAAASAPASDQPAAPFEVDPENGWHVRRGEAQAPPTMDEDPFENNPRLADLRRRIDERLRRKKCDEAAALLQELAQETGGRVVAELAMNAGDRCQSLGKSNAALNCYLAGSRADPVYELPLSRLADICIDDQDTELAVSYLERIARLYRFRGDDKAALRVYRRIATIAPYREDVLTLLLNVQNTGRFES